MNILAFLWTVVKGISFLGGLLVFLVVFWSFCRQLRKLRRARKGLEKRMKKAWDGNGGKAKKKEGKGGVG